MARLPKIAHIALVASVLSGAAVVPIVLSGQASAQSGSRICGRQWRQSGEDGPEIVYKIYEVPKNDLVVCLQAGTGGANRKDPGLGPKDVKDILVYKDWSDEKTLLTLQDELRDEFGDEFRENLHTCEGFTKFAIGEGSRFEFRNDGTKWSDETNKSNLCENMNRSDTLAQMRAYWLVVNIKTKLHTWMFHG